MPMTIARSLAACIAGVVLLGSLLFALNLDGQSDRPSFQRTAAEESTKLPAENVAYLGKTLFTNYLIPVELAGTLLLVATVGAIAITGRRAEASDEPIAGPLQLSDGGSDSLVLGMVGFLARRNLIIMFLSAEMMLQGSRSISLLSRAIAAICKAKRFRFHYHRGGVRGGNCPGTGLDALSHGSIARRELMAECGSRGWTDGR